MSLLRVQPPAPRAARLPVLSGFDITRIYSLCHSEAVFANRPGHTGTRHNHSETHTESHTNIHKQENQRRHPPARPVRPAHAKNPAAWLAPTRTGWPAGHQVRGVRLESKRPAGADRMTCSRGKEWLRGWQKVARMGGQQGGAPRGHLPTRSRPQPPLPPSCPAHLPCTQGGHVSTKGGVQVHG